MCCTFSYPELQCHIKYRLSQHLVIAFFYFLYSLLSCTSSVLFVWHVLKPARFDCAQILSHFSLFLISLHNKVIQNPPRTIITAALALCMQQQDGQYCRCCVYVCVCVRERECEQDGGGKESEDESVQCAAMSLCSSDQILTSVRCPIFSFAPAVLCVCACMLLVAHPRACKVFLSVYAVQFCPSHSLIIAFITHHISACVFPCLYKSVLACLCISISGQYSRIWGVYRDRGVMPSACNNLPFELLWNARRTQTCRHAHKHTHTR